MASHPIEKVLNGLVGAGVITEEAKDHLELGHDDRFPSTLRINSF